MMSKKIFSIILKFRKMTLATKLRSSRPKLLNLDKSIVLFEHKNYRINEPDQFLKIHELAFLHS